MRTNVKRYQNVENVSISELRAKRISLGLSQEELAFEADLSQTSISRAERGVRSSRKVADKIGAVLDQLEAGKPPDNDTL